MREVREVKGKRGYGLRIYVPTPTVLTVIFGGDELTGADTPT